MKLQKYLNEGGYSRMMQVLTGMVPSVKTFAIITWENPMGHTRDINFNKQANEALKQYLKDSYYSYRHIKGVYESIENPYLIMNIKLSQAKRIGFGYEEYKQESIIFGKRFVEGDKSGVIFKMIYHDNKKPDIRRVWSVPSKDAKAMYSEYKGRKFKIPFFDDEAKNLRFVNGRSEIIEDHNIVYDNKVTNRTLKRLNELRDNSLNEELDGYIHRGKINLELRKIR